MRPIASLNTRRERAAQMNCRNCGRALDAGDRFCSHCRTPVPSWKHYLRRTALVAFSAGWILPCSYVFILYCRWCDSVENAFDRLDRVWTDPNGLSSSVRHPGISLTFFPREGEELGVLAAIWLFSVIAFWTWKLAGHMERTKVIADRLSDTAATERPGEAY